LKRLFLLFLLAGKFIVDKEGNFLKVRSEKTLESEILRLAEM
jgi:hypothetical protein